MRLLYVYDVVLILAAVRGAIRPVQVRPAVRMSVAQTPQNTTRGDLGTAQVGLAELLQHKPRLLRPHRVRRGARRGGAGVREQCGEGSGKQPADGAVGGRQLRGEGSFQRTNAHRAEAAQHQQFQIQKHARPREESHPDAGHRAR